MSGRYITEMADWLRAAGLFVVESPGWRTRARSSGGFASGRPWLIVCHHTASNGNREADVNYQINGPDSPIANINLARDGVVTMIAAGASNHAGKGGPYRTSKGVVPQDSGNSYSIGIEASNNGTGMPWPKAQIDAYFTVVATLCTHLGLNPLTDVVSHAGWTPGRKIDPARADAVQGPWRPHGYGAANTWNWDDFRAELFKRMTATPPPPPPPPPPPVEPPHPTPTIHVEDATMEVQNPPYRAIDTRQGNRPLAANEVRVIDLGKPAKAAMVNITAVNPLGQGFMIAWGPGATAPTASVVNFPAGETTANAVILPVDGQSIRVQSSVPSHLIVDVQAVWP